jgi:hypothetical protein
VTGELNQPTATDGHQLKSDEHGKNENTFGGGQEKRGEVAIRSATQFKEKRIPPDKTAMQTSDSRFA